MFDDLPPIHTDDDVLRTAREVIGQDGGQGRTTWVLLLDGDRLLPTIVPITGMPVDPDPDDVERFVDAMAQVVEAAGADRVVVVWERPGADAVRMQEADWVAAVAASRLPLRAQLLATDEGVRLLDPAFEPIVAV